MTVSGSARLAGLWLEIRSTPGDAFDQQIALIKTTGASYDGTSRSWHLRLESANVGVALATLFQAAREHGTFITVQTPTDPR